MYVGGGHGGSNAQELQRDQRREHGRVELRQLAVLTQITARMTGAARNMQCKQDRQRLLVLEDGRRQGAQQVLVQFAVPAELWLGRAITCRLVSWVRASKAPATTRLIRLDDRSLQVIRYGMHAHVLDRYVSAALPDR